MSIQAQGQKSLGILALPSYMNISPSFSKGQGTTEFPSVKYFYA